MKKVDHRRTSEASKKRALIRSRKAHLVRMNALTRAGQDIGKLPKVKNPARRKRCLASFALFCVTYFPEIFYLKWSKDLLKVIAKIERVVIDHDKLAVAMPRGSGKTRLCQAAILWAILSGRHKFAMLIGAVADQGSDAIVWFKKVLSENLLLLADFPEVCLPIRLLDNEPRRCLGQRYMGLKTNIRWGKDRIVLPTIPGSKASGSVIEATSLEGQIRGKWMAMPGGGVIRPTLAMCDDPQTAESARSQGPSGQTTYRLTTINQDVQGLAGPDQQTAILVPCTVICPGDLADQLLNRKKFPDYRGERTKRLYSWPTNKGLWEQYRELRESALQADQPLTEATEFYKAYRATCGLPWTHRGLLARPVPAVRSAWIAAPWLIGPNAWTIRATFPLSKRQCTLFTNTAPLASPLSSKTSHYNLKPLAGCPLPTRSCRKPTGISEEQFLRRLSASQPSLIPATTT